MLHFFRKMRKALIPESRFGRYFFYALGEIVLVVIGILIALNINNWNENQKKLKLKKSFQISLINDLALDTLMLNELIAENSNTIKILRNQQQRFLGSDTPIDTLIKIARFEFDPSFQTHFQYNRNTLNTLIASGDINLFSRNFNEKLMTLISLQDNERENLKYLSEIYATKLSRFSDDYPVSGHQNSNIIDFIWTDIDEKKFASRFVGLTDVKGYAHFVFNDEMEKVKENTINLLKRLNKQK